MPQPARDHRRLLQGHVQQLDRLVGIAADRLKARPVVFVLAVKYVFHRFAYVFLRQFFESHFPIVAAECSMGQAVLGVDLDHTLESGDGVCIAAFAGIDQSQVMIVKRLRGVVRDGLLVGQGGIVVHARRLVK